VLGGNVTCAGWQVIDNVSTRVARELIPVALWQCSCELCYFTRSLAVYVVRVYVCWNAVHLDAGFHLDGRRLPPHQQLHVHLPQFRPSRRGRVRVLALDKQNRTA